jgi:hypothetical protein
MVDRTLSTMPTSHREPLVLFYREQQSVARVAELLELSPDAVKQRLARGRRMLRAEVAALVERGLRQSAPGRAFTLGVLAALPVMSASAQAATVTVASAKGVSAMKAAGAMGVLGSILGPVIGILGGWLGYSMNLRSARSDRERAYIRRISLILLGGILVFALIVTGLTWKAKTLAATHPTGLAVAIAALFIGYVIVLGLMTLFANRAIVRIRREDGTLDVIPDDVSARMPGALRTMQMARVYESKTRFLGLPLVSVRYHGGLGLGDFRKVRPAVGWIAIGDKAYGLFAAGSLAVGFVATGALGFGLVSVAGLAVGGIAIGGVTMAVGSLGGLVLGWFALGGAAVACRAAKGGVAIARDFAIGGVAVAAEVNNEAANAFINAQPLFYYGEILLNPWVLLPILAISMLPWLIALRRIPTQIERPD